MRFGVFNVAPDYGKSLIDVAVSTSVSGRSSLPPLPS